MKNKVFKRGLSFLLSVLMVFSLLTVIPAVSVGTDAEAANSNTNPGGTSEWIGTWHTSMLFIDGNSDSNAATAVDALSSLRQRTFRTRLQVTMGGSEFRLTYSNEYGTKDLQIGEVTIAKGSPSDVNVIDTKTLKNVTFNEAIAKGDVYKTTEYYGDTVYAVRAGHTAVSDPVSFKANDMDYVTVSTWVTNMKDFSDGFTAGLIGGRTAYLGIAGLGSAIGFNFNHTHTADLGAVEVVSPIELSNSDATGDYNIIPFLTGIDVKRQNSDQYATVIIGDSTLANNIPLYLESRLQANDVQGVSFLWSAIKGSELLMDGQSSDEDDGSSDNNGTILGESVLNRFDRDALDLPGVKKIIVKIGINDILHPNCSNLDTNFARKTAASEIIAGYKELIDRAHAKGIEIYFYELTPWEGYTRDGTISFNSNIDAVRQEVNNWLRTYGEAYDNIESDKNTDSYTNTVRLGDNKGPHSMIGSAGYKFDGKPYDGSKTYNNNQAFDSFGYIALDALNQTDTKMKAMYTTDGIHYTNGGQNKVASLTPLTIFSTGHEVVVPTAGEKVQIHDVYCATPTGQALVSNETYYIVDSAGTEDIAKNQEATGYAATAQDFETTVDGKGMDYPDWDWGIVIRTNAKSDITSTSVTVQRGVDDVPYIVGSGITNNAQWTTLKDDDKYFWLNNATNRYLAWYYPAGEITGYRFTLGTRGESLKSDSNGWSTRQAGWYTLNSIGDKDDSYASKNDGAFGNFLYYNGALTDKVLTYYNGSWQLINTSSASLTDYRNRVQTLVFYNSLYNTTIDCTLDIDVQNALNGTSDGNIVTSTNELVFKNRTDSFRLYYYLFNTLGSTSASGEGLKNHINSAALNDNGNNPVGPYAGYTYGNNQVMYWMSSDTSVATVDRNKVTADASATEENSGGLVTMTGNPGTTLVTLNFFWDEFDGVKYYLNTCTKEEYEANKAKNSADGEKWVQVDNNTYVHTNKHWLTSSVSITNLESYGAEILVNNEAGDNFTIEDVLNGDVVFLEVLERNNPVTAKYPKGSWTWTMTGSNVGAFQYDGSEAYITSNGSEGTVKVTATYKDTAGNVIATDDATIKLVPKPLEIDININGKPLDYYTDHLAVEGQIIALEAFVQSPFTETGDGTWNWTLTDAEGNPSDVLKLSSSTGKNVTATVTGNGVVVAKVTYTYGGKTASSQVILDLSAGVSAGNTVIDFGLPVSITMLRYTSNTVTAISNKNDIAADVVLNDQLYANSQYTGTTPNYAVLDYGEAKLSGGTITYTPKEIAAGADTIYYEVSSDDGTGYKYSTVDIIPAADVYYEDSFVDFATGKYEDANKETKQWTDWTPVGEGYTGEAKIHSGDKNDVYGYDETYGQYTQYSLGTAKQVTVSGSETAKASFTFTGTGFEIYSACTAEQGGAVISVYKDDVRVGMKKLVATSSSGEYWQTPVYMQNLDYGTYRVDIEVAYSGALDPANADGVRSGSVTFILDGVRIYNTSDIYNDKYAADEQNARFISVRKQLLTKDSFNEGTTVGAVFIDGSGETSAVADYKNFGPKNEVYLAKNQAIAFRVNDYNGESLQLGMKAANLKASTVTVNGEEIALAGSTAMYYKITSSNGMVVIVNSGDGLVSITNLKISGAGIDTAAVPRGLSVDNDVVSYAASVMMAIREEPAPTEEPQPTEEPTPTEEPEPTEEPDPAPTDEPDEGDDDDGGKTVTVWEKLINAAKRLNEALRSFVSKLFGR